MFRARATWLRFAKPVPTRPYCTTANNNTTRPTSNNNSNVSDNKVAESNLGNYDEAYKQLDKLDFSTAAKILFTDPPKKKKFGYCLLASLGCFWIVGYPFGTKCRFCFGWFEEFKLLLGISSNRLASLVFHMSEVGRGYYLHKFKHISCV